MTLTNMNSIFKISFFAVVAILLNYSSHAQTTGDYRSVAAGNWTDRTRWERFNNPAWATPSLAQGYPGQLAGSANANVTVQHNITLNATPLFGIGSLDVTNEVTLNTSGSPNLSIVRGLHVISIGLLQPAFCTFGNGNLTIGGTLDLDDLCTLNFGSGILAVTGATTIGAEATLTNGGTFNTGNTVTVNTFWFFIYFNGSVQNNGTANLTNTGAAVLNGNGNWTQGASSTLNYTGSTLTVRELNASATSNIVNYNRNGAQTIDGPVNNIYHHLNLTISGTKTTSSSLDINGNLTISGTAQMDVSAGNDDINLAGNWNVTSTNPDPFVEGTRTVNFDGASQTISTPLLAGETFYNLTISGSGNKSTSDILDVNGNLLISGSAQLTMNSNNLSLAGNWTVTSSNGDPYVPGTNTTTFNGTAQQTLTTSQTGGETFYNFIINNSFGTSPQIVANDDITVTLVLTMTDGNVNLNGTIFTISSNAVGALVHTLASSSGWMYGGAIARARPGTTLITVGASAHSLFPLGSATDWRPFFAGQTSHANSAGTIRVSHTNATTTSAVAFAESITLRHDAYWTVSSTGISAGPTFSLRAGGTSFGTIANAAHIRMSTSTGVVGTHGAGSGGPTDWRVNRTAVAFASLANSYHVASTNFISSPLPIELISFSAFLTNSGVELKWSTASETNNDYFTIERATNPEQFDAIIEESGKGTTKEINHYKTTDPSPLYGRSYYRLKQTDFNGKYSYSSVQVINNEGPEFAKLTTFPNPLRGETLTIKIEGLKEATEVPVQILDINGQKVFDKVILVTTPGMITEEVLGGKFLSPGLYIVKAGQTLALTQKIVVE